jgi:hypothetical protein
VFSDYHCTSRRLCLEQCNLFNNIFFRRVAWPGWAPPPVTGGSARLAAPCSTSSDHLGPRGGGEGVPDVPPGYSSLNQPPQAAPSPRSPGAGVEGGGGTHTYASCWDFKLWGRPGVCPAGRPADITRGIPLQWGWVTRGDSAPPRHGSPRGPASLQPRSSLAPAPGPGVAWRGAVLLAKAGCSPPRHPSFTPHDRRVRCSLESGAWRSVVQRSGPDGAVTVRSGALGAVVCFNFVRCGASATFCRTRPAGSLRPTPPHPAPPEL